MAKLRSSSEDEMVEITYRRILGDSKAKHIINDLKFYAFRTNKTSDALEMAYNEGQRALALRILQLSGDIE